MILNPFVFFVKANLQSRSQDPLVHEARSSREEREDAESYGECSQTRLTRRFSLAQRACLMMCITPHWLQCLHARVTSFSIPCMVSGWLFVASLFLSLFFFVILRVSLFRFARHFPLLLCILSWTFIHVDNAKANITCAAAIQWVLLSGRTHEIIGKVLSSPPADRRQAFHSNEKS